MLQQSPAVIKKNTMECICVYVWRMNIAAISSLVYANVTSVNAKPMRHMNCNSMLYVHNICVCCFLQLYSSPFHTIFFFYCIDRCLINLSYHFLSILIHFLLIRIWIISLYIFFFFKQLTSFLTKKKKQINPINIQHKIKLKWKQPSVSLSNDWMIHSLYLQMQK